MGFPRSTSSSSIRVLLGQHGHREHNPWTPRGWRRVPRCWTPSFDWKYLQDCRVFSEVQTPRRVVDGVYTDCCLRRLITQTAPRNIEWTRQPIRPTSSKTLLLPEPRTYLCRSDWCSRHFHLSKREGTALRVPQSCPKRRSAKYGSKSGVRVFDAKGNL